VEIAAALARHAVQGRDLRVVVVAWFFEAGLPAAQGEPVVPEPPDAGVAEALVWAVRTAPDYRLLQRARASVTEAQKDDFYAVAAEQARRSPGTAAGFDPVSVREALLSSRDIPKDAFASSGSRTDVVHYIAMERRSGGASGCFELVLQPGPDSAFHAATQWPGQRAEHPYPAPRAHLPVPAHDRAVAVGGEGQRPGGFHHRAGGARTEPMRPVELGQLHQHLRARPAHACPEPCPQPDGQRSEQLHTSHRRVERRLVARVGDRVKYLLDRRRDGT